MKRMAKIVLLSLFAIAVIMLSGDSFAQRKSDKDGKGDTKKESTARKCKKCDMPAKSSRWKYCPYCGAELPKVNEKAKHQEGQMYSLDGDIYTNWLFGFEMKLPNEDWTFFVGEHAHLISRGNIVALGTQGAYATIGAETVKMKLEDYYDNLKKVMEQSGARELVEVEKDKFKIAGEKGMKAVLTAKIGDDKLKMIYIVFDQNGRKYRIMAWCKLDDFGKFEADFNAIIDSFSFVKK